MARLSRLRLAVYGMPALPLAALGVPVYVHLPTFYVEDLGLGLAATGGALLAARLVDVLPDPIIGLSCDGGPWPASPLLADGRAAVAAVWPAGTCSCRPPGVGATYLWDGRAALYLG